ncbi:MAG: response regulator transcription factor [Betaproteobacteria bacterium]|nr:MAG: response regulator transcription factor [Betaproteobacteria bacterium]TDI82045.1 MAG: response regulator transcription factor [Betaproteobacteria bacterium]
MSNSPLRVMVVDDEAPARNRLKDLLHDSMEKIPVQLVGESSNGLEALALLQTQHADVVLLDIRMPEMDGLELAQHFLKLPVPPAIIFTTAYDVYAIQAFELHAVDYLLKPIRLTRLLEALTRIGTVIPLQQEVLQKIRPRPRTHLSVHERDKIHLIPVGDVVYLRAELKYVTIRTCEKEYLLEESLTRLEEEFGERFVRIHRNCLVAKDYISGFEKTEEESREVRWMLLLRGLEEKLPVSRRQQYIMRELG